MSSINQVCFTGYLTKEPEIKNANGKDFMVFTIAINEWSSKYQETRPIFMPCNYYNTKIINIMTKGVLLGVSGRLKDSSYEKDGKVIRSFTVACNDVQVLSAKKDRDAEPSVDLADANDAGEFDTSEIPF